MEIISPGSYLYTCIHTSKYTVTINIVVLEYLAVVNVTCVLLSTLSLGSV